VTNRELKIRCDCFRPFLTFFGVGGISDTICATIADKDVANATAAATKLCRRHTAKASMREYKSRCATFKRWRLRLRAGDSIASLNVSRPFNIAAISWGNNSSKNAGMVTTVSIRQGDDFNHPF
jgi:hypothetical protein